MEREMIEWDTNLNTGIQEIDDKHQQLYLMVDELIIRFPLEYNIDVCNTTINKLTSYAESHFKEEELIMSLRGYPDVQNHILEHDGFVRDVIEQMRNLHETHNERYINLVIFIVEWVVDHIAGSDQEFNNWLKENKKLEIWNQ